MPTAASADVRLPSVFGDHMVLQREMPVPVWGWAAPGEKVTVTFAGTTVAATADTTGKWALKLPAMKASADSREMTMSGNNRLTFKDVLVGEVWLCGGQSNMESEMNWCSPWKRAGPPASQPSAGSRPSTPWHPLRRGCESRLVGLRKRQCQRLHRGRILFCQKLDPGTESPHWIARYELGRREHHLLDSRR